MSIHSAVSSMNSALSSGQSVGNAGLHFSGSSGVKGNPRTVKTGGSGGGLTASGVSSYIDQLLALQNANNAWSAQQAAELRNWQEVQNQKAMEFNSAEAQKNRDWQQYMSNTAHQREIQDLKAAGLNPVLSAMGGNGAAVTSGATASGVTSSGAKGDTDTSATAAIANLVTSMWNYNNQMEMARMSARTNETIAARNNATAELVAQINGLYGNQRAEISGKYGLSSAQVNASASQANALVAALASILNTNTSTTSAKDIQGMKQEQEKYMAQHYPNNLYQYLNAFMNSEFGDALLSKFGKAFGLPRSAVGSFGSRTGSGSFKD